MNFPTPIQIWTTGVTEGSGGIQAFTRALANTIRRQFGPHRLEIFTRDDCPPRNDPLRRSGTRIYSTSRTIGPLRNALFSSISFANAMMTGPAIRIATHLQFLPLINSLRRFRGGQTAVVLHGIEVWHMKHSSLATALAQCNKVLSVSRFTEASATMQAKLDKKNCEILHNTFEPDRFAVGCKPDNLLSRYGLTAQQPILLTISRLAETERDKGHEEALRAVPMALAAIPDLHYVIGGGGAYVEDLQRLTEHLGITKHVTFTGFIPSDELAAHYNLCDAFIMPSRKEGFGIVFLEAMASGKPVIAGNRDGSPDALDQGRLGVIVDPTDISAIADAIIAVLHKTHPNRLIFDPTALRAAAIDQFGPTAFAARVNEILNNLLAEITTPDQIST